MGQSLFARVRFAHRFLLFLGLFFAFFNQASQAQATFASGDLLVSLSNGKVLWYRLPNTSTPFGTLNSGIAGQAKGMAFDASGNLYVTHWWSLDLSSGNTVAKFNNAGVFQGQFGSGFFCNPSSIVFDGAGNAYVGQADCDADILKLGAGGNLLAAFDAATEVRGSEHVDLAPDQCTVFYTSQGPNIKRYNVCGASQLSNFNTAPLPDSGSGGHALRILPDGGVLVANFSLIARLNASGSLVQTYDASGGNCWLGLDLASDGRSFWTSDFCNNIVARFDLASGALLQSFIPSGLNGAHVKAVKVAPAPGEAAGCVLLVIDEDSIDNGNPPNFFSDRDVNDHIAEIGVREPLPFWVNNVGRIITLHTGQVGDEGWFALKTIPDSWRAAGPTSDGACNYWLAGPGLGSADAKGDRESLLDKIPNVTPLRARGLKMLEGRRVCAVVYDSDVSINYSPLNGSLKGANLGIVDFRVLRVTKLDGFSSSSLPQVELQILNPSKACQPWQLFTEAPEPRTSSEPMDITP